MLTILAFFLALSPAFLVWGNAVRKRRLAESRLAMAKCVTRMETLLLSGATKGGDCVHDHVFSAMQYAQWQEIAVSWNHRVSAESRAFSDQFENEMENGHPEVRKVLCDFVNAYFATYGYDRPLVSRLHWYYLISKLAFLEVASKGLKAFMVFFQIPQEAKRIIVSSSMHYDGDSGFALA